MMRKRILTIFAVVSMMATGFSASAADKLRIGTEGTYPPFNEIKPDGSVIGFDVDIAFALCKKMDVECSVVTQEWDGIIPALKSERFDFVTASMSITDERLQEIDFTAPYYTNKLSFVGKKGAALDISKAGMKGKVIGIQSGTVAETWLKENYPDAEIKGFDNQQKVYADLVAGKLDAILSDMLVSWSWLETPEGKAFEFKGEPVFSDDKIAVGVRKEDEELKRRLDEALREIVADGTYKAINDKYFPFSIY